MTKQEYVHIRNLASDLLIDAKISWLPIDIKAIAYIYNLQDLIDDSKTLYDNTFLVAKKILAIFGFTKFEFAKQFSIMILSPMFVLNKLNIKSENELCALTKLPANLAKQRYKQYKKILSGRTFKISRRDSIVLSQFGQWISSR